MTYQALLLGAIGVVSETSDIQRRAFNRAFAEVGLPWVWEGAQYYALLRKPGGLGRILDYAFARQERVNAQEIHDAKLHHFRDIVQSEGVRLRPGVAEVLAEARARGLKTGFVTTTVPATLDLLFEGLSGQLERTEFDVVLHRGDVSVSKPAPECYISALSKIGVDAVHTLAIEDTPESIQAAMGAGIETIAFPGLAAQDRGFPGTVPVVGHLEAELLNRRSAFAAE